MALIDSAADGLLGAVVSGGFAAGIFWWTNRGRRGQLNDAWREQADELDERLRKQYRGEISWLRTQLATEKEEVKRLNQVLNRQRGRGGGDD